MYHDSKDSRRRITEWIKTILKGEMCKRINGEVYLRVKKIFSL